MSTTDHIFLGALSKLLVELFAGPPQGEAYILNQGDPGLLRQLESVSAEAASSRPMRGSTTVAAHVDHVTYGLSLLNRWAGGEANPWADADWSASWKRGVVSDLQWRKSRDELRQQAQLWEDRLAARADWDDMSAAGAISSAAHTAYHVGAIRQILAALGFKPY
ncbi:hypothetical protein [Humisphaera borealis]|uniref:DinB-like domain-containing protein n=1 Tax=Humisphaera borealis TaxID=2807512 RepID=A0A7M2X0X0_9BACT|nr:hypothetical protein [Humisphaera borealis]QOV91387.1 hypothetical protein IPV69_08550 [Humisphaera borealis]